jgi:Flp pilus assembly protein TadD
MRTTAPDAYNTRPRELNLVGRKLLQQGHLDAAIAFLTLAVEEAPAVALFHTTLGEALALKDNREAALHHYLEAFSLDPTGPIAIEVLRRLGEPIDAERIEEALAQQ